MSKTAVRGDFQSSKHHRSETDPVRVSYHNTQKRTSNEKHPEFFIFANKGMPEKYLSKESCSLNEVVQTFDIWMIPSGSNSGNYVRPDRASLHAEFETENPEEIVKIILKQGHVLGFGGKH